ncbi:MAG TPA: ribonuclease P protein component [Patescibacteria group bacterium]|nr:ribonuclease P protein component [Patescibacteria group bacterium]
MCAAVTMIKASPDFQRIARQGRRWSGSAFIMQLLKTDDGSPFRLGLTASRKVGNAVIRNRAKRRLRELVRLQLKLRALAGFDLVIVAKTAAANHDFTAMNTDFETGLRALKVLA